MTVERGLRLMAGVMVLLSVALTVLCFSLLDVVYSVHRAQSAAIGTYELVSGDVDSSRDWVEGCRLRRGPWGAVPELGLADAKRRTEGIDGPRKQGYLENDA